MLEILGKIGFDWQVALANLINFLLVFWLLKRFAFGPIKKIIAERKEKVNQGLEDARRAATDRQMAEQLREQTVMDAKKEANTIVAEANDKGKGLVEEAKTEAEEERAGILAKAEADAENLHAKMEEEFSGEAVGIILAATEKLLKSSVDAKANEELIKKTLAAK
jgi:F-type H+-transporting ATPase subunit b